MDMTPQAWPDWYNGRHINEVRFCQQFLDKHPMKCVSGRLFTVWALRWSTRCHIKNEERTSKLPYTPYTLYGCF